MEGLFRLWSVSTIQLLGIFRYLGSDGYAITHTYFDQSELKIYIDGCPSAENPSALTCSLDRQHIPDEIFRSMRFHVFTSSVEDIIREELDQSSLTYCTKDLAYQNVFRSACPECRFKIKGCRTTPRKYLPIHVSLWADLFVVNESFTPRYLGCAVDIEGGDSRVFRLVARTRPIAACGQSDNVLTTAAAEIPTSPRQRRRTTTFSGYEIDDPQPEPNPGSEGEITDVPERISLTVVIVAGFGAFAGLTFAGLLIFRRISKTDMTAAQDIADYITQSGSLTQHSSSIVSSSQQSGAHAAGGGPQPEESFASTANQLQNVAQATKVADLESSQGVTESAKTAPEPEDLQSSAGYDSAAATNTAGAAAKTGCGVKSSVTEFGKKSHSEKVAEPPATAKPTQAKPSKMAASLSKMAASPSKMEASPSKMAASPSKMEASPSKMAASPAKTASSPSKRGTSSSKIAASPSKMASATKEAVSDTHEPPPQTKASRTSAKQSATASATAKDKEKQSSQSKKPSKGGRAS